MDDKTIKDTETNLDGISFQDIVDKIPAHIYWKDINGRCLGGSHLQCHNLGLSRGEYIGKTDFDIFPQEQAKKIVEVDRQVLSDGVAVQCEEITTRADGSERIYLSHKIPLKNKQEKIVGLLGVSVDVTDAKKKTLDQLSLLESIISAMPGNVYWMDRDGIYLGCNDNEANSVGLKSKQDIVGKRNIDISGFVMPDALDPVNEEVIQKGVEITVEEPALLKDGSQAVFLSKKVPLYNSQNEIAGLIGISFDITEKKKAEQALKEAKEKAEAMNASALQVAHDIRSPLAAIMMLTKACKEIPEAQRVSLREATERIQDIANQLLTKHDISENAVQKTQLSAVLVSTAVLSVISSKRVEYERSAIKFKFDAEAETYFSFILANVTEFKRILSNVINNAVEAMSYINGEVIITLKKYGDSLAVAIADSGCGLSKEKIQQLLEEEKVETSKKGGHGLGLTHTKEMLKIFNGKLKIQSIVNAGTTVELIFTQISSPEWIADEIKVNDTDCIVILDDDHSIHGAWDEIFSRELTENSNMKLMHFTHADECVAYIGAYPDASNILLLTDYELISQNMNGLDAIARTQVKRAILVTSYYESQEVIQRATLLNTKILPKTLAVHVNLKVSQKASVETEKLIDVDLIMLEDDQCLVAAVRMIYANKNKKLKAYSSPYNLLEEVALYPKSTKICTDYELGCDINGMQLAEILHQKGYQCLYLSTGYQFRQEDMPSYLTVLANKADVVNI